MSNPVPPPGGAIPPEPDQGQTAYPPAPGQPLPSQPVSGQSLPGQPVSGQPLSGQPFSGEPVSGQPFPGPPAPGQAMPGQPAPGFPPPGQAFPGQPAPGFPPPPPGQGGFAPFPTEQKKKSGKARLVRILGAVVAVAVLIGLRFGLPGLLDDDKAQEAKVGDCVAAQGDVPKDDGKTTEADAAIVDCKSAKAKFTVVGRVEGETDTASKSCDKYFTDDKADYFVYSSTSGNGYLLCLQAKA